MRRLRGLMVLMDQAAFSAVTISFLAIVGLTSTSQVLNSFAVIQFATSSFGMLARGAVIEPSLALRDNPSLPGARLRTGFLTTLPVMPVCVFIAEASGAVTTPEAILIGMLACLPAFLPFLRASAQVRGRLNVVVGASVVWVASAFTIVAIPGPPSLMTVTVVWAAGAFVAIGMVFPSAKGQVATVPMRAMIQPGLWLTAAALANLAPAWLGLTLALASDSEYPIGAFRLLISLLGPFSIAAMALIQRDLLDAPHLRGWVGADLASLGRKRALVLVVLSSVWALAVGLLVLTWKSLPTAELPGWVVLSVLLGAVLGAAIAPYGALLRALDGQGLVGRVRLAANTVACAAVWAVYAVGLGPSAVLVASAVAPNVATAPAMAHLGSRHLTRREGVSRAS